MNLVRLSAPDATPRFYVNADAVAYVQETRDHTNSTDIYFRVAGSYGALSHANVGLSVEDVVTALTTGVQPERKRESGTL